MDRRALLAGSAAGLWAASARAQQACFNRLDCFDTQLPGPSLDLQFTAGTLDPRITFSRADATSCATYFNAAGTLTTVAANVPRFDFDPVTHAPRGLLIEEARTNLWLNSADVSAVSWVPAAVGAAVPTKLGNQVAAPDGTLTGGSITFPAVSGGSNRSVIGIAGLSTAAAAYSLSFYMRAAVAGGQFWISATPDGVLYYRQLVTVSTVWQRFTLTTPALTAATWFFQFGCDCRDAGQTGMAAQTVYVWGAQLEQAAFPTSYIPTTAAAATRAADVATMPVGSWYSPSAGAIVFEGSLGSTTVPNYWLFDISDGTFTNAIRALYNGGFNYVAGGALSSFNGVIQTIGVPFKFGMAWNSSGMSQTQNGAAVAATPGTLTLATMTTLSLGTRSNNTFYLDGYIRRVRYWPRALGTGELQAVTL